MSRRRPRAPRFDVASPTVHPARDGDLSRGRRRYFMLWAPCVLLVLFGFFVPAPTPWRIAALALAAPLLPLAAVLGTPQLRK